MRAIPDRLVYQITYRPYTFAFYNFSQQTTGKGMLCLVNAVEWMQGPCMLAVEKSSYFCYLSMW